MTEVLASRESPALKNTGSRTTAHSEPRNAFDSCSLSTVKSAAVSHASAELNGGSSYGSHPIAISNNNSSSGGSQSPKNTRSPRCEAFVMTGDKILSMNPKISPCYAKVYQSQLPPTAEVESLESTPKRVGPFDDFPSMHKLASAKQRQRFQQESAVPGSQSEHFLNSGHERISETDNYSASGTAEEDSKADYDHPDYDNGNSLNTLPGNGLNGVHGPNQNIPPNISSSICSRLLSSQSTPASPARRPPTTESTSFIYRGGNGERQIVPSRVGSSASDKGEILAYPEGVARLARHLFTHQEGIKIASFLVKSDELSKRVSLEFLNFFNFAGLRLDAALRTFLSHVCLNGETTERAQLLTYFSGRYYECNPTLFSSADEIHVLTCALLLLNTDLHGRNGGKKMTCREFIDNLAHYSFDRNLLKSLYASIKETPFKQQEENSAVVSRRAGGHQNGGGAVVRLSRVLSFKGSLLVNPNQQIDYKHGWLLKKSIYDADGKRTPYGRRKWEMLYATIRGMVLYLHKNENSFVGSRFETFNNCVLLHHSLAEIPKDYTKRKNVFRLRTANLGEFLFQTSEPDELQKWIDTINYVAAAFSTPALPTPVSSAGCITFYRPLLPSAPTTFSIQEQLAAHEQRLEEAAGNLSKLRDNAPSMKARGKAVYDYFYKERYLDKERERYAIYTGILRDKLCKMSPGDPSLLSLKKCSLASNHLLHSTALNNGSSTDGPSERAQNGIEH